MLWSASTERPVLRGRRVVLRLPRLSDIEDKVAAGSHADIVRSYGGTFDGQQPSHDEAERWFEQLAGHPYAWNIEHEGGAVGEIRLDRLDRADRRATLAVGLNHPDLLGRGLGREAMRLVLDHAFTVLRLHRVGLRVLAFNERAIAAYRKCGFVVEGREREAALVDGVRHDDIMMGLLASEWHPDEG